MNVDGLNTCVRPLNGIKESICIDIMLLMLVIADNRSALLIIRAREYVMNDAIIATTSTNVMSLER